MSLLIKELIFFVKKPKQPFQTILCFPSYFVIFLLVFDDLLLFHVFVSMQRDNDKDHKVRLAIGNGLRAEIWREFLNRFGDMDIREFYASTEGNVGFINYAGKIGAIGRVNFFHRVRTIQTF